MLQDLIVKYYRSLYEKIKHNNDLSVRHYYPEGIHDLRVSIKRVRALFNLIKSINPDFKSKIQLEEFRNLFKAAAEIRDIQVQQYLIKRFEKKFKKEFVSYGNYLKEKEVNALKHYIDFCKHFDITSLKRKEKGIRKTINDVSIVIAETNAEERFNDLMNQLVVLKNSNELKEEKLHQIRILSKEIRYTLETLQVCFPGLDKKSKLIEALKELHQALGGWHDDEIGLEFLKIFETDYSDDQPFDNGLYNEFTNAVKEEKKYLVKQFENKWEKYKQLIDRVEVAL